MYFEKIEVSDFIKARLASDRLLFTDIEINAISKYGYVDTRYNTCPNNFANTHICLNPNAKSRLDLTTPVHIYKLEDEWYYIYNSSRMHAYKCDQFEGLIKCLDFLYDVL